MKTGELFKCTECGIEVENKYRGGRKRTYCSRKCACKAQSKKGSVMRTCEVCGSQFKVLKSELSSGKKRGLFCSSKCLGESRRGENNPNFNDGYVNKHGYKVVRYNGESVLEHRKVMSEHLGRTLLDHENVHHLNGVKHDNRIENLELWSSMQPSGQRVADKVVFAKEILEIYGEDYV